MEVATSTKPLSQQASNNWRATIASATCERRNRKQDHPRHPLLETSRLNEVTASLNNGTPRADVRDLHLVKNEDLRLFGQLSSQSFQRVPRRRRPPMLALALRPGIMQPSVDLEHELVEVDSSLFIAV